LITALGYRYYWFLYWNKITGILKSHYIYILRSNDSYNIQEFILHALFWQSTMKALGLIFPHLVLKYYLVREKSQHMGVSPYLWLKYP
jgi:hypothetical protein